jgi:hypothetical protein
LVRLRGALRLFMIEIVREVAQGGVKSLATQNPVSGFKWDTPLAGHRVRCWSLPVDMNGFLQARLQI